MQKSDGALGVGLVTAVRSATVSLASGLLFCSPAATAQCLTPLSAAQRADRDPWRLGLGFGSSACPRGSENRRNGRCWLSSSSAALGGIALAGRGGAVRCKQKRT